MASLAKYSLFSEVKKEINGSRIYFLHKHVWIFSANRWKSSNAKDFIEGLGRSLQVNSS